MIWCSTLFWGNYVVFQIFLLFPSLFPLESTLCIYFTFCSCSTVVEYSGFFFQSLLSFPFSLGVCAEISSSSGTLSSAMFRVLMSPVEAFFIFVTVFLIYGVYYCFFLKISLFLACSLHYPLEPLKHIIHCYFKCLV